MNRTKTAAVVIAISGLASACAPRGADPATTSSPPPAPSSPAGGSPQDRHAAGIAACDVFREAVGHFDAMGKGSKGVFGPVSDALNPLDTLLEGKMVWVDDYWESRISESLSPNVPDNVLAALEKVVSTGHVSNVAIVQSRPDEEYKPAADRAGYAADSADRICGNFKH